MRHLRITPQSILNTMIIRLYSHGGRSVLMGNSQETLGARQGPFLLNRLLHSQATLTSHVRKLRL